MPFQVFKALKTFSVRHRIIGFTFKFLLKLSIWDFMESLSNKLKIPSRHALQLDPLMEKWVLYMNSQLLKVWMQEQGTERTVSFPTEYLLDRGTSA